MTLHSLDTMSLIQGCSGAFLACNFTHSATFTCTVSFEQKLLLSFHVITSLTVACNEIQNAF